MTRALFLRDTPEGGAKKNALPPDRQLGTHLLRLGRRTLAAQVRALCLSPMVDHKCRLKATMLSVLMFRIGLLLLRNSAAHAYVDPAMRWRAAETMNFFAFLRLEDPGRSSEAG